MVQKAGRPRSLEEVPLHFSGMRPEVLDRVALGCRDGGLELLFRRNCPVNRVASPTFNHTRCQGSQGAQSKNRSAQKTGEG